METIIKEDGVKAIQQYSGDAIKKRVELLSLEANEDLISALYAESLMPSLDEQIGAYETLIAECNKAIEEIETQAAGLKGQEAYELRRTKKPFEEKIKMYQRGRDKLLERKAQTLERINNFRMDAQLNMHKIAHALSLGETVVADSLTSHIEALKVRLETPKEDAPVVETTTEEDDVETLVDTDNADDVDDAEETAAEANTRE